MLRSFDYNNANAAGAKARRIAVRELSTSVCQRMPSGMSGDEIESPFQPLTIFAMRKMRRSFR